MRISRLYIADLRNHTETTLGLSDGLNIFSGNNGSGKTTILEAISICSFSKSFLPVAESSLVNMGKSCYTVSLEARSDLKVPYRAAVKYGIADKKRISSSLGDNITPKELIGMIPVTVLSPDFKNITFGAPQDRRNFLDRALSQLSRVYYEDWLNLRKCIKQRNNLLSYGKKNGRFDFETLESYTEMFILASSSVVYRRKKFIEEFANYFIDFYRQVSGGKEIVGIKYQPNGFSADEISAIWCKEEASEIIRKNAERLKIAETSRGATLFGPQKDDLAIMVNGGLSKEIASQGQHKSLLISIKLAEFVFLKNKLGETPIILLDDIFSELDETRTGFVMDIVSQNAAQTFITLTEDDKLKKNLSQTMPYKLFSVKDGHVSEKEI